MRRAECFIFEKEDMGDKFSALVEDFDTQPLSMLATPEEISEMAEGIWSCFHNDHGTMKFNWSSGFYSTKGWKTQMEFSEERSKLSSDLLEGTHWKDMKLSMEYNELLKKWTREAFESETRNKYYMTCPKKSDADPKVQFCMFSTFSADRTVYAQHKYGFCRAGREDTAILPQCPAVACYN